MRGKSTLVNVALSLDIMQRVTRCREWANVAAAGRVTKRYCRWSLGVTNIALM